MKTFPGPYVLIWFNSMAGLSLTFNQKLGFSIPHTNSMGTSTQYLSKPNCFASVS